MSSIKTLARHIEDNYTKIEIRDLIKELTESILKFTPKSKQLLSEDHKVMKSINQSK